MKNVLKALLAAALVASMAAAAGCGTTDTSTASDDAAQEQFVFANSGAYRPFSFDEGG